MCLFWLNVDNVLRSALVKINPLFVCGSKINTTNGWPEDAGGDPGSWVQDLTGHSNSSVSMFPVSASTRAKCSLRPRNFRLRVIWFQEFNVTRHGLPGLSGNSRKFGWHLHGYHGNFSEFPLIPYVSFLFLYFHNSVYVWDRLFLAYACAGGFKLFVLHPTPDDHGWGKSLKMRLTALHIGWLLLVFLPLQGYVYLYMCVCV